MATKTKKLKPRKKVSGPPTSHVDRAAKGHVRLEVTLTDKDSIDALNELKPIYNNNVLLVSEALRELRKIKQPEP